MKYIFLLILITTIGEVSGQSTKYILKGKLTEENVAFPSATVELMDQDSVLVKTVLSDDNGDFSFLQTKGNYVLKVKFFGKYLITKSIQLDFDLNLGLIDLYTKKQLAEVVISGRKKIFERKIDRLIFNVDGNIAFTEGSAVDILKITPNLLTTDEEISMVGKSGVILLVNDKQVKLSGSDLINFMRSIPAKNIANVEIFTIPPAKYDADGNSGLVNIVLKKNKANFYNGSLNSAYTRSKYSTGNIGGNINFQKEKVTITSSLSYVNGSTAPFQNYKIYYNNFIWDEDKNSRVFKNDLSGNVSLNYQLNKKTDIGVEYSGLYTQPKLTNTNRSSIYNNFSNKLDSIIITPANIYQTKNSTSLNFYSTTKLDSLGKTLYIEANYFDYISNADNLFATNTYLPNGEILLDRQVSANDISNQSVHIYTSKFDFQIPLKVIPLSFGAKVAFIKSNSNIQYFNTLGANPVFDPQKSNSFDYMENTQSAYLSAGHTFKNNLEVKVGLRDEYTQTGTEPIAINNQRYNQLFPTLFLAYPIKELYLTLGYSKRINRPTYRSLNPFRYYSTYNNYTEGNPFLIPYYSHNIELSLSSSKWIHTLYYSVVNNSIDEITLTNQNNTIQITRPLNFLNSRTIGLSEYFIFNKFKNWRSTIALNIFHKTATSFVSLVQLGDDKLWTGYISGNNSFNLNASRTLSAEINFLYQTANISNSYKASAFFNMDSGIKYGTFKNKLLFSILVNDVFRTSGVTFTNVVNNVRQEKYSYNDAQKIRLQLNYNFGGELKINRKKEAVDENRQRIR